MPLQDQGLIRVPFGSQKETRIHPRYTWDNYQRGKEPFVIVQHTLAGEGRFEIGGVVHRVLPGHALIALVPEKSRYRLPTGDLPPWTFAWVNFFGELALRLWTELRAEAGPVIPLSCAAVRQLRQLARGTLRRGWTDPYQISAAAYRFYLEVVRHLPSTGPRSPARDAALYFQAHYEQTLRMKEVADRAGMSREHFTRIFRQEMGRPPAVYLRELRLERAARLLRTTTMPLAEVALRSGWPSTAKLDYFFRRRKGVSLREFQKTPATAG